MKIDDLDFQAEVKQIGAEIRKDSLQSIIFITAIVVIVITLMFFWSRLNA